MENIKRRLRMALHYVNKLEIELVKGKELLHESDDNYEFHRNLFLTMLTNAYKVREQINNVLK